MAPGLLGRVLGRLGWARSERPGMLDVRSAYALWAPSYPPRAHTPLMQIEEAVVLELLPPSAGRRVLDLGCGSGRYLRLLRPQRPQLSVGLDLSSEMLARARPVGDRLVQGDVALLPFADRCFDLAVAGLVLGHVPALAPVLREIARVTRPEGVVVYSDLHPAGQQLGWVRSFRAADGREYIVPHHPRECREHEQACRDAGLDVEAIRQPLVEFPHPWQGLPAALIIRARRMA